MCGSLSCAGQLVCNYTFLSYASIILKAKNNIMMGGGDDNGILFKHNDVKVA